MKQFILITILFYTISSMAQSPRITFVQPMLYPEGTAYDSVGNRFFVSSARKATIGVVDTKGNYTVFYDDANLKSTYGIKIDTKRNLLWVCTGDPNYSVYSDSSTYKKKIGLVALELGNGKKVMDIDLSNLYQGKHFANDLTLDYDGNIYVTDSYSPVIYKIDTKFKASVFANSFYFKALDIGLNGIVWHPDGYLLVVQNSDGSIYKISTKTPSAITKVAINNFFVGGDGLLLDKSNNLFLVQNKGVNKVFQLKSIDNWQTAEVAMATVTTDRFQNPSTATFMNGKVYALNAKLNELQDPTMPPSKEFSLQLAEFKAAK